MKYRLALVAAVVSGCLAAAGQGAAALAGTTTTPTPGAVPLSGVPSVPRLMSGATATTGTVLPASFTDCPQPDADHQLCFWSGNGYTGSFWDFNIYQNGGYYNNEWRYVGSTFNDRANSLYNKRVDSSYLSKDWLPGPSNYSACAPTDWSVSNLSQYGWPPDYQHGMGNSISAIDLLNASEC